MAMLAKAKKAVGAKTGAFDAEITDLIHAAIDDMKIAGVVVPDVLDSAGDETGETVEGAPLLVRAIMLYCKADFKTGTEAERYRACYENLKATLAIAGDGNADE